MLEFEPGLIIWTTISFGILVLLLYKAALPPLLALLAQREKNIADALSEAAANRLAAEKLIEEHRRKLAEIHQAADKILERSKSEGVKLKEEILARAEKQAELLSERARQDLSKEKDKIISEVREHTAEMVAAASAKLLRQKFSLEDNRRLIDESLKEAKP